MIRSQAVSFQAMRDPGILSGAAVKTIAVMGIEVRTFQATI
jgi:hypothetical protein